MCDTHKFEASTKSWISFEKFHKVIIINTERRKTAKTFFQVYE